MSTEPRRSGSPPPAAAAAASESLSGLLVPLIIFVGLLLGVLFIFDLGYRLARGRSDAAERQEALRSAQHDLVRLVRMAGRGGLPQHLAIEVRSNVAAGTRIGGADSPRVVAGTDILTVRGVFSTPLFRVGPADGSLRLGDARTPLTGAVEIRDPSPQTGVEQSLAELAAAVTAAGSAADSLLLVSQLDESIFAVVETDPAGSTIARDGDRVTAITLSFRTAPATAGLANAGPVAALHGAALVGLLEEFRFYIRAAHSAPGDERSAPRPQLSMARFIAGTDRPWAGTGKSLSIDLADDVVDLQVALGVDADGDGRVTADPTDPGADEWLYNDPDDVGERRWSDLAATLRLVRLTTVLRLEPADANAPAPARERLEDRLPEPATAPAGASPPQAPRYRLWRLESVVDLKSG